MMELIAELGMELAQLVGVLYVAYRVRGKASPPVADESVQRRAVARQFLQSGAGRELLRERLKARAEAK